MEITSATVQWYANKTGLDSGIPANMTPPKSASKSRLSGGYWQVIARGDPLTEEAGNCEQDYCLVRGVDACKECREKDMLQKENKSSEKPDILEKNVSAVSQNLTEPQASEPGQEKSFIRRVTDWIWQLLWYGSEWLGYAKEIR